MKPIADQLWLQPFLVHTGNLQVLSLFGQLPDPAHGRFKLPPVTINDTYGDCCPLPLVLKGDLGNGGIETGTQTIFKAAHGAAFVLQGPGPGNHQFDGEQRDEQGWIGHGVVSIRAHFHEYKPIMCPDIIYLGFRVFPSQ